MSKRSRNDSRRLRAVRGRKKVSGDSERPRLSIFLSNKQVYAQVINDVEGVTVVTASTLQPEIKKEAEGKSQTESAKLVGQSIAKKAADAGIKKLVFDKSGYKYAKKLGVLADAVRESGIDM